jgi:2-haloacid dehalogenase
MAEVRWATFDCYGTLVDWNAGISRELHRLLGSSGPDGHLARYHAVEPRIQSEHPDWSYRDVMAAVLDELASEASIALVMLSNSDRDLIESSIAAIGVPFDGAIVASEIGSYKPGHRHWSAFYESTGADRRRHVHVAQSHFHDIVPAHELGIPSVWINRLAESHEPPPTRELPTLAGLADVLDELVR